MSDLLACLDGWHKEYVRDIGTASSSNQARYVDDKLTASNF